MNKQTLERSVNRLTELTDVMSKTVEQSKTLAAVYDELGEPGKTILRSHYVGWLEAMGAASEETGDLAEFVRDLIEAGKENSGRSQAR